MQQVIPLSLYIHFPWCVQKCPYCDFNSHALKTDLPEAIYIQALLADLEQDLPLVWGRRIISIFMGGGTPSLFSANALDTLLQGIRARLPFVNGIEITLEANPGTIEHGRFADYKAIGINRISLGAQSFNPQHLKQLGRIHNQNDIYRAVDELRHAGLENFNLDIMHGLPGQTAAQAEQDIEQAIQLKPTHISWYQLTLEPNTLFYAKPPVLPGEAVLADIETVGKARLAQAGYEQYEISAYSQPGKQSVHNLNYWQFGDYLGIGAGAHGKVTTMATGEVTRRWKQKHPKAYLDPERPFVGGEQVIEQAVLPLEFMLNALRLNGGFSIEQFESYTGLPLQRIVEPLQAGYDKQLLVRQGDRITTTALGQRFLNDTLQLFS